MRCPLKFRRVRFFHKNRIETKEKQRYFSLIFSAFFGFSNHLYGDEFAFEKTQRGCEMLEKILRESSNNFSQTISDENQLIERLFDLLNDHTM